MPYRTHYFPYRMDSRGVFLLNLNSVMFVPPEPIPWIRGTLLPRSPWTRVFIDKLIVPHLFKRLLTFLNRKFHHRVIKNPTCVCAWARVTQVTTCKNVSQKLILVLYSDIPLCVPSGLCPSLLSTKTQIFPLLCPLRSTCVANSFFLTWFPEKYPVRNGGR